MTGPDPIALTGRLGELVSAPDGTTARFRLTLNPTWDRVDQAVLPCRVSDPLLAYGVHDHLRQSGHLVRVTGYLRQPATGEAPVWLEVLTINILDAYPPPPEDLAAQLYPSCTIAEDGLVERCGGYLLFHDPIGVTSLWTQDGTWVGQTEDLEALHDLITAFEQRTSQPDN
jgi:hypothetical protein